MIDSCCDSITRKILNDLSSDAPAVPRIEEEKAEEDSLAVAAAAAAAAAPAITTVTVPTPIYQTSSGQYSRWTVCGIIWSSSKQMHFLSSLGSWKLWLAVPVLLTTHPIKYTVAITQGGAIQLANNGTDGVQGLPTLTMTNAAAAHPGATILQYAQTSDGQQILVPSNQVVVQGEWDFFV